MKKILIFVLALATVFGCASLKSFYLGEYGQCKTTSHIQKGKVKIYTLLYCKDGIHVFSKIKKIKVYVDTRWNEIIKEEYFDSVNTHGAVYRKKVNTYKIDFA